uniref:WGS project CAEQ00000000 data, annotated contig 934 n=1 Tax=Trypanosoma congolense (strain IL3000) TaxID=1068625 RepID=F9WJP4_TRYCI|nr:unnamed protein product [Trypanosoma congolense IL3000]
MNKSVCVCAAADCGGVKVNLRFLFDASELTVSRMLRRATVAFSNYFRRKGIEHEFAANSVVVFNDAHCTWDRLERTTQLFTNSQVYLFQPDTVDVPAAIPEPIDSEQFLDNSDLSGSNLEKRDYVSFMRHTTPRHFSSPRYSFSSPVKSYERRRAASPFGSRWSRANSYVYGVRRPCNVSFEDFPNDKSRFSRSCSFSYSRDIHSTGISDESSHFYQLSGSGGFDTFSSVNHSGVSILREERKKIDRQLSLPLDDMRYSVREETRRIDRIIRSPIRRV